MRRQGTGNIQKRKSGRYSARCMGFMLGTYDTKEEAEAAILAFTKNKCPWCKRSLDAN